MSGFLYIVNSMGEKENFSARKVYRSARRVGASKNLARKIARDIGKEIYPGITTAEIFEKINTFLSREFPQSALRFNLKKGMRKLGPTGFPFEKYIGEIFKRNGFEVQINQYIPGFCCSYEVDFLAKKGGLLYLGECKYRNQPGGIVDLGYALANRARFLDIEKGKFFSRAAKNLVLKSLLVTNAKFTGQAIRYSECVGVELLGWSYPRGRSLQSWVDEQNLYPITVLPSLKPFLAAVFVSRNIVLAKDLLENDEDALAKETGIQKRYLQPLVREAGILLSGPVAGPEKELK